MTRNPLRLCVFVLSTLAAGTAPAQQGPPQGQGGPDRGYLYGQILRAIDEKASMLIEQGKGEAAAEEMKRASTIDVPKDHPVFEMKVHLLGRLAITYTNLGRKQEALDTIRKVLDVPLREAWPRPMPASTPTVYRQSGQPEEALKAFDRATELQKLRTDGTLRAPEGMPPNQPEKGGPAPPAATTRTGDRAIAPGPLNEPLMKEERP
jgi:tetratricopeptide (TPR) repeat protein